jgi:hypothetical protein
VLEPGSIDRVPAVLARPYDVDFGAAGLTDAGTAGSGLPSRRLAEIFDVVVTH